MSLQENDFGLPGILLIELDSWNQAGATKGFPYSLVGRYVRSVGKHFLPVPVVDSLVRARQALSATGGDEADRAHLHQFLSVVLDRYDETFDYQTYTALDLLRAGPQSTLSDFQDEVHSRIAFLVYDALAFECSTALNQCPDMPYLRPDADTLAKRLRHGLRIAGAMDALAGKPITPTTGDLQERLDQICEVFDRAPPGLVRRLDESLLPVYVIHDEYLFIRILQSFESVFEYLARMVTETIARLEEGDLDEAVQLLSAVADMLQRALPLFSLLATMRRESFEFFRQFTEGASAIQSANYKAFEALCGTPNPARTASAAFDAVPDIRERVLAGSTTVRGAADAYLAAHPGDDEASIRLGRAMGQVESIHQRWKQTHYRLAVRMIGAASGTGYTAGTPYLKSVIENRLFRSAQEAAR